jgi:NADH-quinone oxidoreductase subunit M
MLWLYQRTMFGKLENPANANMQDLNIREFMTFAPLIALAVWIGIYPTPILRRIEPAVTRVVQRVNPEKYGPAVAKAPDCTTPGAPAAEITAPPGFAMAAPCMATPSAAAPVAPIKQDGGTH